MCFSAIHEFQNLHAMAKKKIQNFVQVSLLQLRN